MKAWRESASLIIAVRNGLKHSQLYDYSLLFLKRHRNTNYGNSFVFPGGMIEPADADLKWQNLFQDHGYNNSSFNSLFPNVAKRPLIFQSKKDELPREISLRISAIRETFEECGILICKKSDSKSSEKADNFPISYDELEFWQHKVHSDATEFFNMCKRLDCYPNLWALHEWGNWLTPTFFPQKARFDTAFFFTCLSEIPKSKLECNEMEELLWEKPDQMMASYKDSLPPPQQYEITTIAKYKRLDNLLNFALEKARKGSQLYLPIRVILRDGAVHLLPGDSMYPNKVNMYEKELIDKTDMTITEFRDVSSKMNRQELFDDPKSEENVSSKL